MLVLLDFYFFEIRLQTVRRKHKVKQSKNLSSSQGLGLDIELSSFRKINLQDLTLFSIKLHPKTRTAVEEETCLVNGVVGGSANSKCPDSILFYQANHSLHTFCHVPGLS